MKNKILGIFTSLICLSSLASCADSGRQIVSIAVYNGDNSYVVGESFADTQLAVTYDNGEKELVDITLNMVEGFDTSVAGTKTLIISYGGLTTEFEITVSNLYIAELVMKDGYKSNYLQNDKFQENDATIIARYTDEHEEEIPVTEDMLRTFDTSEVGLSNVIIYYEGLTISYPIMVAYPKVVDYSISSDTVTTYFMHEEFKGITLNVTYENGVSEQIIYDDENEIEGFDTSTYGMKTLTLPINNEKIEIEIEVKKEVKSLALKPNQKLIFERDEELESLVIIVTNYDDTTEEITLSSADIEGFDTSKAGITTIKYTYGGKSLDFDVIVPLVNLKDYEESSDKRFVMQAEDEDYVDLSEVKTYSDGLDKFEEAKGDGSTGKCTANFGQVPNQTFYIRFYSSYEGVYSLEMNSQSASNSGGSDQVLKDVMSVEVDGVDTPALGTAVKAGTGNWANMTNWGWATIATDLTLHKGLNTITIHSLNVNSSMRLPNIDAFAVTINSVK